MHASKVDWKGARKRIAAIVRKMKCNKKKRLFLLIQWAQTMLLQGLFFVKIKLLHSKK